MRERLLLLAILLTWCTGCPADGHAGRTDEVGDGDGDGDDPNGDPMNPPPVDPLGDKDTPECGLAAHPASIATKAPSSLGNGLVHDSRLSLDDQINGTKVFHRTLAPRVAWSAFVDNNNEMARVGFRPAQVRAEITATSVGPALSHLRLKVRDRSLYIADDDANYRTEIETYIFSSAPAERALTSDGPARQGARPTSIEAFVLSDQLGKIWRGYSVAWVYDDGKTPWKLRVGLTHDEITNEMVDLSSEGYRPISVSSRSHRGRPEYAAIFVKDGTDQDSWDVSLGVAATELESAIQTFWKDGFYPFRISGGVGSETVNVLWIQPPMGLALEIRLNLTMDTFRIEDSMRRSQGYYLETIDRYRVDGSDRYVAVWVQYSNCLRWTGTEVGASDLVHAERHAMFHNQAVAAMTFAGTELEGRVARPSATLHVFEGNELVFNRAYTFAPAIYPNTRISTPMRLASASKSITAAAVVKVMYDSGLPLTTPYTLAAWILDAPSGMDDVTVLDALRNMGGFRAERALMTSPASLKGNPTSYLDHTVIDASPQGVIPIDGREMFNYAVSGGHLDTNDADSYWDLVRYEDSQAGRMHYSNPGFSMLGEVVRGLSEIPYEQYVTDNLLAPLNLERKVFADPGHRKNARGPTLAGLRAYLSNQDHPYRYVPPGQVAPVEAPRFGTERLPKIFNALRDDSSMRWGVNVGPPAPGSPGFASLDRYSGSVYLGGAPLAAGGWYADGESLGLLIRALSRSSYLMPVEVAKEMWNPKWKNDNDSRAAGWSYCLGWYVRGNWVAWAGGMAGSMATVLYNRVYDVTIIHLSNTMGNGLDEFMNPLMLTDPVGVWNTSKIGEAFPCEDEASTPEDECDTKSNSVPY